MRSYLIIYNLHAPGQKYSEIKKAIENHFPLSHQVTRSTWYIKTPIATAVTIRDLLKPSIDSNDQLLVQEITNNWATYNYPKETADWLNSI